MDAVETPATPCEVSHFTVQPRCIVIGLHSENSVSSTAFARLWQPSPIAFKSSKNSRASDPSHSVSGTYGGRLQPYCSSFHRCTARRIAHFLQFAARRATSSVRRTRNRRRKQEANGNEEISLLISDRDGRHWSLRSPITPPRPGSKSRRGRALNRRAHLHSHRN